MKLKYVFDSIYSNSNTITVKSGPTTVITLSKADFDNDWSNIYGKEYEISDLDCNDLARITINGAEAHTIEYDEETNTKWKEFAKNKFGTNHLDDFDLLRSFNDTVDEDHPLKIYIQTMTNWNQLKSTISQRFTAFIESDHQYTDLSETDMSFIDYASFSSTDYTLYQIGRVTKLPPLPKRLTTISGTFKGANLPYLVETPLLPDTVVAMTNAFSDSKIRSVTNFPSSIKNANNCFSGCSLLTEFPWDIPSTSARYMFTKSGLIEYTGNIPIESDTAGLFSDCGNLKYIRELNANSTSSCITYKCSNLSQIDYINIDCTKPVNGGDLYLSGKVGDFNIGIINIMNGIGAWSSNSSRTNVLWVPSQSYLFDTIPTTVTAAPYWLCKNRLFELPSSTGSDIWVDYIFNETEFVHSIMQNNRISTFNVETLNSSENVHLELDILKKNVSYNHEVEILNVWIDNNETISCNSYSNMTSPSFVIENDKLYMNCTCSNISDDSVSYCEPSGNIYYTALIDGHEFHGSYPLPRIELHWQINEGIGVRFFIEEDEVESDEPTDDSSSEPVQNEE